MNTIKAYNLDNLSTTEEIKAWCENHIANDSEVIGYMGTLNYEEWGMIHVVDPLNSHSDECLVIEVTSYIDEDGDKVSRHNDFITVEKYYAYLTGITYHELEEKCQEFGIFSEYTFLEDISSYRSSIMWVRNDYLFDDEGDRLSPLSDFYAECSSGDVKYFDRKNIVGKQYYREEYTPVLQLGFCSYGAYDDSGIVERSNHKAISKELEYVEGVLETYGSFGSKGLIVTVRSLLDGSIVQDIVETMEDTDIYDDSAYFEMEQEFIKEQWEDWGSYEVEKLLCSTIEAEIGDVFPSATEEELEGKSELLSSHFENSDRDVYHLYNELCSDAGEWESVNRAEVHFPLDELEEVLNVRYIINYLLDDPNRSLASTRITLREFLVDSNVHIPSEGQLSLG